MSGLRCQASGRYRVSFTEPMRVARCEKCENEGSSGDVEEKKGWQVSCVRCQEREKGVWASRG